MKKKTAFWIGIITLVLLYLITALLVPAALSSVGSSIALAIAAATIGYQSSNVADNAFKGKYYRKELDARYDPAGGEGGAPCP